MKTRIALTLLLLLSGGIIGHSQERRSEFLVDFRINSTTLETQFGNNGEQIRELTAFLDSVRADSSTNIISVTFCGAASPDGSYQVNRRLAQGRLAALEKEVRDRIYIPEDIIFRDDNYIPWNSLSAAVMASDIQHRDEILEIIGTDPDFIPSASDPNYDERIVSLKALYGGSVWKDMVARFLGPMRMAGAVIITYTEPKPEPVIEPEPVVEPEPEPEPEPVVEPEPEPEAVTEWQRKAYVKTNAIEWALAITNIGGEIDLCPHLSFNLPILYSAWNYFTYGIKFRTLAFSPELRWWFYDKDGYNDGWFLGAHFGLGWYNVAVNGDYRIQDHNGRHPALGGGLDAGYRMPISKNRRWQVEFSLGVGVYSLYYDKFHDYKNGLMTTTTRKTYFGPDQASVSFSYSFDIKKKGGRQ